VGDHGTAIANRDDLAFGLWKILRKERYELLTIGWHRKSYLWSKPSPYFRGGSNIKSGLIDLMKTSLMTFGIAMTIMALPVLAQSISPFQPEELKAINEQPLVPPQGVMGNPKPASPETAPRKVIIGPNYTTDQPGEAEAKALGEDSAQPLNPREGLITIPFN